ncbi:MAG TPA: glycosyltransferase family 1 protein [Thermoanaerobaculia bacterium]|nr:glycosyltransferase family 1 protein [Thermoanaerobaculia bacterium]
MTIRRIALDISSLDFMAVGGQIRYATDLIRGLTREDRFDLLVVGSTPEPLEAIRDLVEDPAVPCRYVQFLRSTFPGGSYLDLMRLGALLNRENIALFHALHTLIPIRARCVVVATAYDAMYELFDEYAEARCSRPYRMHIWLMRMLATRVICISEATATDVAAYWKLDPRRLDVVYPGVDQRRNSDVQPGDRTLDFPYILSPFNLEPRKNLPVLLEAFSKIRPHHRDLRLVLFGKAAATGDRERDFEKLIERLALRDSVIRTGVVPEEALAGLYAGATIFVFPSLYEGFGYPVLEAMSAGTCVLARPVSAMAEVIGDAGAYADVTDSGALASELESLLRDGARRARLGTTARERARSFSVEKMTQDTARIYDETLRSS